MSDTGSAIDPVLDAAPCGFLSCLDDGTLTALNATLLAMVDYPSTELVGRHIESILTIGSRIFYQTHLYPLLRLQGRADEIFLILRVKDGSDVGVLANAVRHERNGRSIIDMVLLRVYERRKFEDALLRAKKDAEAQSRALGEANAQLERQAVELEVSNDRLLEQAVELEAQSDELRSVNDTLESRSVELEHLRRVADEANRAKSMFLTNMSHELRTPLNAIGGYTQLLEMGIHGTITDAQRDALGRIATSQRHLLRLINDLLNLARIEAGRIEYHLEVIPLRDVIDTVLPMVEPQRIAHQLRCDVDVPPSRAAYADREKVQQIVLNLVANAIKFTPPDGRITIDSPLDERRPDLVFLRVRDTGSGIPDQRLEEIFDPFTQVSERSARPEGTGLGLPISRNLARGMGGDLRARSHQGAGSSFTLTLPLGRVER